MKYLFSNNATSRLRIDVNAPDAAITLATGDGEKFPDPTGDDFFMVTLDDRRTGQMEICKCTQRNGDILVVERAQEGTTAQHFMWGAVASHRITAGTFAHFQYLIDSASGYDKPSSDARFVNVDGDTMTGPLSIPVAPTNAVHATSKQYVDDGLNTKAALAHTHPMTDISGLDTALAGKVALPPPTGEYIMKNNAWTALTFDELDGKPPTYPPDAHQHPQSDITNLTTDLTTIRSDIATKIGDAPNDGQQYARRNAIWQVVTLPPGSVSEAPSDGVVYGRKNATWSPTLQEAPIDGKTYGRKNGAWLEVQVDFSNFYTKAEAGAQFVDVAGDAMTGDLAIRKASAPTLTLDKTTGATSSVLLGTNAFKNRWSIFLGDYTSETGSNAGSDFAVNRYTDAGALIDTPIKINRATGATNFSTTPTVAGQPLIGGAVIADAPPGSPIPGQLWWESDSGVMYLRVDDGNSQQWVDVSGSAQSKHETVGVLNFLNFPAGCTFDYWGQTAPPGALFAYGQAVSRTTYAALFAVLGTWYGAGDGSTTFNLPDLRGRTTAGSDNMGGTSANRVTSGIAGFSGALGNAGGDQRVQSHNHTLTDPSHNHPAVQNAHNHGINDPGHYHSYVGGPNAAGTGTAGSAGQSANSYQMNTLSKATGITLDNAQPAVSVSNAYTGISLAAFGAGASQNMQPTIMCNKIMTTGGV